MSFPKNWFYRSISTEALATQTGLRQKECCIMPQSLSVVYLHLVFSTKERRPFLRDKSQRLALRCLSGRHRRQRERCLVAHDATFSKRLT